VRHTQGAAVGGDLDAQLGPVEKETPGRVAVANFTITNTGDATDIIRVGVAGELSPLCLNDLYAVGAGETITVPVYVELPVDIRTKNMSGKYITLSASSETNGAKVGSAKIEIPELIGYNYNVYFVPSQTDLIIGDSFEVDVMLQGDINYTGFTADVTYNPALLKCTGYGNMSGFVTACSPTAVGTIGIRCIPSTNMVLGASCANDVKIVTLKFTVLDGFQADDVETALSFATVTINPPAGYLFMGTAPSPPLDLILRRPVLGNMANVALITGSEVEIEFDEVVTANNAQQTFGVFVDGQKVEYEFLSYFDFGSYAIRKGVVNIRLKDALDAGEPRGRKRTGTTQAYLDRTEHIKGPIAASRIRVEQRGLVPTPVAARTAVWEPFYLERSQGYMSEYYAYASADAGNNGSVLKLNKADGTSGFYDNRNVFTATSALYTDEYVVRMVGESMNHLTGRAEYLNLPMIYDGFKALIVGPAQSVYEVPEYRELYQQGVTTDTFSRKSIKASDVPGNLDPAANKFKKTLIVGTSDDIFNTASTVKADGSLAGSGVAARLPDDHFDFGEAFFDTFYHLGVVRGSQNYPLTAFNNPDDFRFDLHLAEAYEKAKAAGMWQGTKMMDSLKEYYIGGALTHFEMMKESQNFERTTWPINTRAELEDYDYPLFWAMCGIHSQYQFWCGTGTGQNVDTNNDTWKYHTPWFWQNQMDEYGLPATPNGTAGVAYPPLAIEKVEVVDHNAVHITFNREVKTLQTVSQASNWRIYIDGREVTPTMAGGYTWKAIRLTTNHAVNYQTGASTSNAQNRLDNGKPYGRFFSGFTAQDIAERKIEADGWIANNQAPGLNALEPGEFVGVQDAIMRGADTAGKIEVAYVGAAGAVTDWSGNGLERETKYEAGFMPWVGNVYRTPLTGFYIYLDSKVGTKDYYMYRNEPAGFVQPGAREVAMAAGHQYETEFTVNTKVTYPINAGGADFDKVVTGKSLADWNLTNPSWGIDYTWTGNGTATLQGQTIRQGPITYDRPGQMTIDGYVRQSGGLMIAAGNVRGGHPRNLPHRGRFSTNIGEVLRVEGNGGNLFDTIDVAVLRDYNLALYRNESLVHHEGGHGIDSALGIYAQHVFNDITSAYIAATAPGNGMRYFSVDGVRAYNISTNNRSEYVSMGSEYYSGVCHEQTEGINDGIWTPLSNRREFRVYDPYGFEALKRLMFNGDLGLWYEGKVGDPDYRVIPEDWELLKDENPQFSDWTDINDLISWGLTITPTARDNPYTGTHNSLVRWISYNNPCIWQPLPYAEPTRTGWRSNILRDFEGGNPYFAPDGYVAGLGPQPTKSMEHPFFSGTGINKPVRPANIAALVAPVTGTVVAGSVTTPRPVLVQFELTNPSGAVTMNNAPASFELKVNGQLTHFYFWTYTEAAGVATVTLRLEWPLEPGDTVEVATRGSAPQPVPELVEEITELEEIIEIGLDYLVEIDNSDDLEIDTTGIE
jgi:hypothetical protein